MYVTVFILDTKLYIKMGSDVQCLLERSWKGKAVFFTATVEQQLKFSIVTNCFGFFFFETWLLRWIIRLIMINYYSFMCVIQWGFVLLRTAAGLISLKLLSLYCGIQFTALSVQSSGTFVYLLVCRQMEARQTNALIVCFILEWNDKFTVLILNISS